MMVNFPVKKSCDLWGSTRLCFRTNTFLIYINDLPASSEYFTFKIFADDTNLFHTFPARENDIDMFQINRQDVANWCKVNKLTINISKTNYIVIRGRHRSVNILGEMKIADIVIKEVDGVSFV